MDNTTPRVTFDAATLSPAQRDGLACVICGRDHTTYTGPAVPVGVVGGGQVFACEPCAAPRATVPGTWPGGEPETVRMAAELRQAAARLRADAARLDEHAARMRRHADECDRHADAMDA